MIKTIVKVDEGCESIYETATAELERIDSDLEAEKALVFASIEEKYASKRARLANVIGLISHEEYIEEPDEVVEEESDESEESEDEAVEAEEATEEPVNQEEIFQ